MAKGYWLAFADVHDTEDYKAYVTEKAKASRIYRGRFLTRGGHSEGSVEQPRSRTIAIEFPTSNARLRAALAVLPAPARSRHERALYHLSKACGCVEGAVGALFIVVLVVARFACTFIHWSSLNVAMLAGQVLLAFLMGGFMGKFLGLAIARVRLRALCNRIQREARQSGR